MTKELTKQWKEIEDKLGLKAVDEFKKYLSSLFDKIRDLTDSRENWKNKYQEQKKKVHALENHIEMLEAGK